jgi:hypothetical protein
MKKNTAKKIIKSLFQLNVQQQPKSSSTHLKLSDNDNSSQPRNTAAAAEEEEEAFTAEIPLPSLLFKWTQNKCTASVNNNCSSSSSSRTGAVEVNGICVGEHNADADEIDNDEESDTESSLVLAKDLSRVWKEFPQYHQFSTVRVYDIRMICVTT